MPKVDRLPTAANSPPGRPSKASSSGRAAYTAATRGGGEIGKRAQTPSGWLTPCGFEPGPPHIFEKSAFLSQSSD